MAFLLTWLISIHNHNILWLWTEIRGAPKKLVNIASRNTSFYETHSTAAKWVKDWNNLQNKAVFKFNQEQVFLYSEIKTNPALNTNKTKQAKKFFFSFYFISFYKYLNTVNTLQNFEKVWIILKPVIIITIFKYYMMSLPFVNKNELEKMVFPRFTGRLFYIGYFPGLFQQIVVIIYIAIYIYILWIFKTKLFLNLIKNKFLLKLISTLKKQIK